MDKLDTARPAGRGESAKWDLVCLAAVTAFALGFFVLLVIGAVRWYSPVPYADMWNGYVLSYVHLPRSGFLEFLWSLHNEHRIPISRLMFWTDLRFFGGRSLLLIPLNIVFMVALWATVSAAARQLMGRQNILWPMTAAAAALPIFSWVQWFNVSSGFQGQFFLAYLLPLLAFTSLAQASLQKSNSWFVVALLCGVGSAGTMANGLATLPLMGAALLLTKHPPRSWLLALAVAAVTVLSVWFLDYHPLSGAHPTASMGVLITFVAAFLGSPFAAALGAEQSNLAVGYVAGAVFILGTLLLAATMIRRRDPMFVALLAFIAYVGLSAAAAAWARASQYGVSDMIRYTTPAAIAWSALLVLTAALIQRRARVAVGTAGFLMGAMLLPNQLDVLGGDNIPRAHRMMAAALALELKVPDAETISFIYPISTPEILGALQTITDHAEASGITMFADERFARDVRRLGQPRNEEFHACDGTIETIDGIDGHPGHIRVTGWVFDAVSGRPPPFVYFADDVHIVGVAVTGGLRPDVERIIDPRGTLSGFHGYVAGGGSSLSILCVTDPTM